MNETRYSMLKKSDVYSDDFGNIYYDIFTIPIEDFKPKSNVVGYYLTDRDLYRFDLLIFNHYGSSNYDDFILWYNNIEKITLKNPGDKILLPSRADIDNFYREKST